MEEQELIDQIRQHYRDSTAHLSTRRGNQPGWLDEAEKAFRYAAGDPWSVADYNAMVSSKRAPVTFNKIDSYVDAVVGVAINNEQKITFYPRGMEDAGYGEYLTDIHNYVADEGEFKGEELECFRDMLICGMGWTESYMDYSYNLDGDLKKVRFDPLRMRWDPTATQINLRDTKWRLAIKDFSREELEAKYDLTQSNFANPWDSDIDLVGYGNRIVDIKDYGKDTRFRSTPRENEHVGIYQYQEYKTTWRVATQQGIKELTSEEYAKSRGELDAQGLKGIKQQKMVMRQALALGNKILKDDIAPVDDMFSFQVMTGKLDRLRGVWYGIVRPLMGPQQWQDKFMSTMLHLIASSPKGGLLAEAGAFVDIRDAEAKWNRSESIILASADALSNNRIMPKPQTPYPQGVDRLLEITQGSMKEVAGISPEMMGMSENVQAGVLENTRRQASIAVLSWAFNSLRIYRKLCSRLTMNYVREYMADGRLARIHMDNGEKYLPILKDKLSIQFDTVEEESPSSPNVRERTWAVLSTLLPQLLPLGIPIPPDIIDYLPLPEALKIAWKDEIKPPDPSPEQQAEQKKQQELQQRMLEANIADLEGAAQQKQATAQLNMAKIKEIADKLGLSQKELEIEMMDIARKREEMAHKGMIEIHKANVTLQAKSNGERK